MKRDPRLRPAELRDAPAGKSGQKDVAETGVVHLGTDPSPPARNDNLGGSFPLPNSLQGQASIAGMTEWGGLFSGQLIVS
jgi:hypothetical protein